MVVNVTVCFASPGPAVSDNTLPFEIATMPSSATTETSNVAL